MRRSFALVFLFNEFRGHHTSLLTRSCGRVSFLPWLDWHV